MSLEEKNHIPKKNLLVHRELINARDRYIAHREDRTYEGSKVFLVLNPQNEKQFFIGYQCNRVYFNDGNKILEIIEHLRVVLGVVQSKAATLREKLTEEHKKSPLSVIPD